MGVKIGIMCFLAFFSHFCCAQRSDTQSTERVFTILQEAEDHLSVLPEKSYALLKNNASLTDQLDSEQLTRWYLAQMNASASLVDNDSLNDVLTNLAALNNTAYFSDNFARIINNLGAWFRREGYLEEARKSFLCALDTELTLNAKTRALMNIAVVERNLNHTETALELNQLAHKLALENGSEDWLAIIENNMGVLMYARQEYAQAEIHFTTAMDINQRLVRRSGEILSGLNLLLSFYQQKKDDMFMRLYPRFERMLLRDPDTVRSAYLKLMHIAFQLRRGEIKLVDAQPVAQQEYEQVKDRSLQAFLFPILTEQKIQLPPLLPTQDRKYTGQLLKLYSQCNWAKYPKLTYIDVLKSNLNVP